MNTIFLKLSDLRLRKKAQEIPENQLNSSQIKKVCKLMVRIIRGEQKGHKRGVGLAAPQIGVLKRIILVDAVANKKGIGGDLRIYINPKIIWKSKRKGEWYEGCYSTGRVCGIVSRPISIKIQALKLHTGSVASIPLPVWKAKLVEEKWTGYTARIFQHEIDHLDGKLFIDHIKNPDKLHWVEQEEFPLYRNKEAWRNWPKKCSFEKLRHLRNSKNLTH